VLSLKKDGVSAKEEMEATMTKIRNELPKEINNTKVLKVRDYKTGNITDLLTGNISSTGLPNSDVLFFEMEDKSNLVIRPSGTEPIIKLYFGIPGISEKECNNKLENYIESMKLLL